MIPKPIDRRGFLHTLAGIIAAPAIVRIDNIMPVRTPRLTPGWHSSFEMVDIPYDTAGMSEFPGYSLAELRTALYPMWLQLARRPGSYDALVKYWDSQFGKQ